VLTIDDIAREMADKTQPAALKYEEDADNVELEERPIEASLAKPS